MLLDTELMYNAMVNKDSSFEGLFIVGVKTTGIFCRPSCTARTPKRENVEFFPSVTEAQSNGYRPCKICTPLEAQGKYPAWLASLMNEVTKDPSIKISDADLKFRNIDPAKIRRWFMKHYGITFHTYLRRLKVGNAIKTISNGSKVIEAAYNSGYESLSGFTENFKKTTGYSPKMSTESKQILMAKISTPLGEMLACTVNDSLCLLEFTDRTAFEKQVESIKRLFKTEPVPAFAKLFTQIQQELDEYFAGDRIEFTIPLVYSGTPFQEQVWNALMMIPYGETRTYSQQAEMMNNPKAVRAVGTANGRNRIAIIIPCHRVIGADGSLTGYAGGISRKQFLLELEDKNR